ncbi:unnamed protein product, partial [Adineta steineri]
MHLENSDSYDEQEIRIDNIESCTMLRNVIITGVTSYRHEFQTFFAIFGSTIQFLTINITILENQPFLTQLEHDVLNKMPLLSSFNFFIKWNRQYLDGIFVIDTQIFQNSNWQRFGQ